MDVRNAEVEPIVEHGGTCLSWFLVGKEEMRAQTSGSYLEFVSEFELQPGVHSIRPADPEAGFRALAFAVSFMPEDAVGDVPA